MAGCYRTTCHVEMLVLVRVGQKPLRAKQIVIIDVYTLNGGSRVRRQPPCEDDNLPRTHA